MKLSPRQLYEIRADLINRAPGLPPEYVGVINELLAGYECAYEYLRALKTLAIQFAQEEAGAKYVGNSLDEKKFRISRDFIHMILEA